MRYDPQAVLFIEETRKRVAARKPLFLNRVLSRCHVRKNELRFVTRLRRQKDLPRSKPHAIAPTILGAKRYIVRLAPGRLHANEKSREFRVGNLVRLLSRLQ